ncbi:ABC transporter substrate-binding protein [Nocardioides sp. C4-1]|uniref:peptide ABC transporter substrate-binding protein n=1 Tax=Nocardioides sp. C4-1 TaxID=3151851 RepID=UPI0032630F6D
MTTVLAVGALGLALAACGGDSDSDGGSSNNNSSEGSGGGGGEIVVRGCNPENPLVPGNTAETCGGDVLDTTTAKLIHYNAEDAAPEMDIAESIETDDNQNFTVTLKSDYKFSDGTPVTAKSFVDAWNYTAYGPNAQQGSYFYEPIEGFADVQCTGEGDDPCADAGAPKAETMTGLTVVDDTSFTIKTTNKVSNLPVRLGYSAFAPLPESFFADPEAYADNPVGAGPYMVESNTPNDSIVVVKNPEYTGDHPGTADKITFKIYADASAAYADLLGGQLDVLNEIPTDALPDERWKQELDGRGTSREIGVIQMAGIDPTVDTRLENPDLRKAISMAIDRQSIIDAVFAGTREPATGWVSPVVDGYKADQCGEACVFDPEAAKDLWDSAGGIEGDLTLTVNGDADHGPWAEAACNSIRQTLDVECTVTPTVDFSTFLTDLGEKKVKGLFRQGWQMDYPSIENFLVPLYSKDAASNYYSYDSPDFQRLTTEAAAAEDLDTANGLYQQAEALLAEDMRIIPLWYSVGNVGWSDRVDNVSINAFGVPNYGEITVN